MSKFSVIILLFMIQLFVLAEVFAMPITQLGYLGIYCYEIFAITLLFFAVYFALFVFGKKNKRQWLIVEVLSFFLLIFVLSKIIINKEKLKDSIVIQFPDQLSRDERNQQLLLLMSYAKNNLPYPFKVKLTSTNALEITFKKDRDNQKKQKIENMLHEKLYEINSR